MKAAALAVLALTPLAYAQHANFVLCDRNANALWRLTDLNDNGSIEPTEVFLWFNGTNAVGTIGIENTNGIAFEGGANGRVIGGDQVLGTLHTWQDLNGDGDAQDIGESIVSADATNASLASFAFPTGAGFSSGQAYVVNAGNGFGNDRIFRLVDLDADGRYQSAGEVLDYVGANVFGANGPYSPQEILLWPGLGNAGPSGLLRNSSANLHGLFAFDDLNADGDADDAGEFRPYWTLAASGATPTAGFALDADPIRPGAWYVLQLATGAVDQVIRVTDANNDGDANDAGEAQLVFAAPESGFTSVDLIALPGGDLLITDNSGITIIRLHDADNDGLFSASERSPFFAATGTPVMQSRQLIQIADWYCPADVNRDGGVDGDDVIDFFARWDAGSMDLNGDGGTDGDDVIAFFGFWDSGC